MTLIHEHTDLEKDLMSRGCIIKAYSFGLENWRRRTAGGNEDWPETEAELEAAHLSKENVVALKELAQMMTAQEKQSIDSGLKELASRFVQTPHIPEVPAHVTEQALESVQHNPDKYAFKDLEYWHEKYPVLDFDTALALYDEADGDLCPAFAMFAYGAYFVSQAWTDDELQGWMKGVNENYRRVRKITTKKRAKLYATLTYDVISHSSISVGLSDLEHIAGLVQHLPLQELQMEIEKNGIEIMDRKKKNTKAALVLALVEHLYADVIEPAASS